MRILSASLAFAVIVAAGLVGSARAEDAPKPVTLKGTQECAKCALKEADAKVCQDVLMVKDGDKTVEYYITKDDVSKTEAPHACHAPKDDVSLTGTVTEKDGKKWLTLAAPAK